MKTGQAYWNSKEKRALDLALVGPMVPALSGAKLALRLSVEKGVDLEIAQMRVGRGDGDPEERLFAMRKLHTLQGREPLSPVAALFRKLGIDELAQVTNIWRGDMSVFGPRPLVKEPMPDATCYDEVMDSDAPDKLKNEWGLLVRTHLPGIAGTWPLHEHTAGKDDPNRFEMRMDMDLRDARIESTQSNLHIMQNFISLAIQRRLQ